MSETPQFSPMNMFRVAGESIDKAQSTTGSLTWRDSRDTQNYRAGLIAHQEIILHRLSSLPIDSPERAELIKDYRFLYNYQQVEPNQVNPALRQFFVNRMKSQVCDEHKPKFERFVDFSYFRQALSDITPGPHSSSLF